MSLSLLASTAFETARSTFKAMADAAVPPAAPAAGARPLTPAAAAPSAAAPVVAEHSTTPKPVKGQRLGAVLDAYA